MAPSTYLWAMATFIILCDYNFKDFLFFHFSCGFILKKEFKGRVLASCLLMKTVVSHDDLFVCKGQLRNKETSQN